MSDKKSAFLHAYDIDVTEYLKQSERPTKDGKIITMLPWSTAHRLMMSIDSNYSWTFERDPDGNECHYYRNGTAEVRIKMTVLGRTIQRSYPIHDDWQSIQNPSATQIHTAKQRCRVATMAEFGLNLKNYEELDVVDEQKNIEEEAPKPKEISNEETIDNLWKDSGIHKTKTFDAAKKVYDKFLKQLNNLGLKDYQEDRFLEFVSQGGFKETNERDF